MPQTETTSEPFRARRGYWRMRDRGEFREIKIRSMSDAHLQHAVRSVERAARAECVRIGFSAGYYADDHDTMGGELAARASGDAFEMMDDVEECAFALFPKYAELSAELDRRGLDRLADVP